MLIDRIVVSVIQVDAMQSLRPMFIILVSIISMSLVIYQHERDWHRTDFRVFLILGMLLLYRSLYGLVKIKYPQQADYLALGLIPISGQLFLKVSCSRIWRWFGDPARLSSYLNLVFAILLIFQVVRLSEATDNVLASEARPEFTAIAPLTGEIHLNAGTRPDIYVIVLDGYGRQDVLQQIYGYDNTGFLQELEGRGFYVANASHSNYVQTPFSVVSLLNFDYVQAWRPQSNYARYLNLPIQANRVYNLLDEIGYTTISFETGPTYTQIESSDVYLSDFLPFNKFETFLLMDSPIEPLSSAYDLEIAIPSYETHRKRTLYTFDELKEIPASIPGPRIVYAHILLPHPPFAFDGYGNSVDPQRPYTLQDGDEFEGSLEEYREGYQEQVMFANNRIMDTVDAILANSKTPPIIILMSDHGPGSMFRWDINSPGCLWERTSNLYAVLLPGHQNDGMMYSSMTPVNSFRVIFNTYFGTELPLLEDRTYLMASQYQGQIADITQTRDSTANCSVSDD